MKLPITCVTAIASPSARPSPSMIAATTPPRVYGRTTPRTISQRVAPRANAPSSSSRGTARKSSRQIAEVIGMVMIVSTTIAVKTLLSVGVPKIGMNPSLSVQERLDVVCVEAGRGRRCPRAR